MKDVNRVTLLGRLGADPILRQTAGGVSVAQFPVATSRRVRKENESEEFVQETQWHQVVVWGKTAEFCAEDLKKGASVLVDGHIRSRKYEAQDGNEKWKFEIHTENVSYLRKHKTLDKTEAIQEIAS